MALQLPEDPPVDDWKAPEEGDRNGLAAAMAIYKQCVDAEGGFLLSHEEIVALDRDGDVSTHIPVDADGQLLSLGSIPHACHPIGTHCRVCSFWPRKRCPR